MSKNIYSVLAEKAGKNKLLVFIGAGASIGGDRESGLPSGGQLNQSLIDFYGEKDILDGQTLDKVTEYIEKKYGRKALVDKIYETIKSVNRPLKTHRLIAELPVKIFVTTNYDDLLEKALKEKNKESSCITSDSDITSISNSEINIFKIHGCINTLEDDIIITESDYYEKFLLKSNLYIDILKAWLTTHTCLFFGYSLSDVNLKYLFFEISKKTGIERTKGRFYAIQKNPHQSDIEIWEKRGFMIVSEDKNVFLDNLIEEIEFKELVKENGTLVSKPSLRVGRLQLHEVRKYEKLNGDDGQRFVLLTDRKMKYLGVENGDWVTITMEKNGLKNSQLAKVYRDGSPEEHAIRMPLVVRNLLHISIDSETAGDFTMTINKAQLSRMTELRIDSEKDSISALPIELDNSARQDEPVVALRNLEFLLLELNAPAVCTVILKGKKGKIFHAKTVLFKVEFNPGRAMIGINGAFREQLSDTRDRFELILKKTDENSGVDMQSNEL